MNWIVGEETVVGYSTHEVSTSQAEKHAISPFVEAFSVQKKWKNAVKLTTRLCDGSYEQCAGQRIVRLAAHFSKIMQHLRGVGRHVRGIYKFAITEYGSS
jgi:hypothetical protein